MDATRLDAIRARALDRVAKRERDVKLAILGAGVVEGGMLATFLLLADLSNRSHLLLLVASLLVYSTLALGLVALGAHMNRVGERVLMAVELLAGGDAAASSGRSGR
jgi:hypothetical protein